MTLHELYEHRSVIEKTIRGRNAIADIRARAYPASPNMDGMPHASGISDKVFNLVALLEDAEKTQSYWEKRAQESRKEIFGFTSTIEDPVLRMQFNYRFAECMSWEEIAGDGYTADAARKAISRYMDTLKGPE